MCTYTVYIYNQYYYIYIKSNPPVAMGRWWWTTGFGENHVKTIRAAGLSGTLSVAFVAVTFLWREWLSESKQKTKSKDPSSVSLDSWCTTQCHRILDAKFNSLIGSHGHRVQPGNRQFHSSGAAWSQPARSREVFRPSSTGIAAILKLGWTGAGLNFPSYLSWNHCGAQFSSGFPFWEWQWWQSNALPPSFTTKFLSGVLDCNSMPSNSGSRTDTCDDGSSHTSPHLSTRFQTLVRDEKLQNPRYIKIQCYNII